MFNWISGIFAGIAFDMAIYSSGLASGSGMYQIKEPETLQKVASEYREMKDEVSLLKKR